MANTYIFIASNTVGSGGTASVTFSSIPSTYTDLLVKASARNSAVRYMRLQVNSVTSGYTGKLLRGNGSAVASFDETSFFTDGIVGDAIGTGASLFNNQEFYIPNYRSSTVKSVTGDGVQEDNVTGAYQMLTAGLSSDTAAITSITISPDTGTLQQYSSFYLYGIKNS